MGYVLTGECGIIVHAGEFVMNDALRYECVIGVHTGACGR